MANVRSTSVAGAANRPVVPGWRPSLFTLGPPHPDPTFATLVRHDLAEQAWVDHARAWVDGSAELFERLVDRLAWSSRTVTMYGRQVDEPRLTAAWPGPGVDPVAGPAVEEVRRLLSHRYGVALRSTWANLYRDGRDSVAWHGDRVLRQREVALVAIVSLGEPRPFRLRPVGGGDSVGFDLGLGDLLVMGGSCQRTWQHGVPKVRRAGPRLSLSFRAERPGRDGRGEPLDEPRQSALISPIGQDTPVPPSPQ